MPTLPNIVEMFLHGQNVPAAPTKVVNITPKMLTTEERVKLLEDAVAELTDKILSIIESKDIKSDLSKNKLPLYTKLYPPAWFNTKEVLEVTPFGFKLQTKGIITNSLQQATELVGAKGYNFNEFWHIGTPNGATLL